MSAKHFFKHLLPTEQSVSNWQAVAGRGVCRQIFRISVGISCLLSRSIFQILFEFVCNHAELFNRVIYLIQIPQLTHFLGNTPESVRVGF